MKIRILLSALSNFLLKIHSVKGGIKSVGVFILSNHFIFNRVHLQILSTYTKFLLTNDY